MVKGTTPTHTFTLPYDGGQIAQIKITYAQDNLVLITKRKDDCVIDGQTVSVKLTQEETFLLNHHRPVSIQIRVLTVSGTVMATPVISVPVQRCLDSEVLTT